MSLDLAGIIGNTASGGLLGLIGSVGTGIVSIFQAKQQYRHDEAMASLELQRISTQSEANLKLSAEQLKLVQEQGADNAFQSSQAAASAINNLSPLVADIVALVRPFILTCLIGYTIWLYPHSSDDVKQFISQVVLQSLSMVIGWYFGSRQMLQFMPAKPQSN